MSEEKIKIYEDLLKNALECDEAKLDKIIAVLKEARRVYGEKVYNETIKDITFRWEVVAHDMIHSDYYNVLTNIVHNLVNLEEVDDFTYDNLSRADYNDPKTRFKPEDFELLPVSPDKKTQVTQRVNEFLDLFRP